MYAYAFLLCLLEVLTTSGALPSDHPADQSRPQKHYEKMWERDGGGRPAKQPSNFESRRKRQAIPNEFISEVYRPTSYYGDRSTVLVSIKVAKALEKYHNDDMKQSYGVRLQSRLILTVCSAVTYSLNPAFRVTYYNHFATSEPVTEVNYEDITVQLMSSELTDVFGVNEILIHPRCDNQYLVDLAIVVTEKPLLGSRNVWVHTAENLLFRRTLDRVVAASAILGKCTVPVFKRDKKWGPGMLGIGFANVHFQHWDGCKPNVCPFWGTNKSLERSPDEDRCRNVYTGTRICLKWIVPRGLCHLGMGTPIFCDVGNIHGLMGFIVTETFECFSFNFQNAIMQGVNDGIDWLRMTLINAIRSEYIKSIPPWMANLRTNYSGDWKPMKIPIDKSSADSPLVEFRNFVGNQIFSVVNVYYKSTFKCRGTLVSHDIAVLPCSCITLQNYDMTEEKNILEPHPVEDVAVTTELTISMMINGSYPFVKGLKRFLHKKCDSHYLYDSAYIQLAEYLPNHKLAWVMTTKLDLFKKMLYITSVADASMGFNCYWLNNEIPRSYNYFKKSKIRFVPWTRCIDVICPNNIWKHNHKERCFGNVEPLQSSLFCIESLVRNWPACDISHGTPIYCNVEQARGFIGYVSTALDLHFGTKCYERAPENQTAVMVGIDQILPDISLMLWIDEVEKRLRVEDPASLEAVGQSSCQLLKPSSVLILGVFNMVLISLYISYITI